MHWMPVVCVLLCFMAVTVSQSQPAIFDNCPVVHEDGKGGVPNSESPIIIGAIFV